jgi:hypothetical protein
LPDRVKLVLLREQSVRQEVTKIDNSGVILRLLFAGRNGQDGSGDYHKALVTQDTSFALYPTPGALSAIEARL